MKNKEHFKLFYTLSILCYVLAPILAFGYSEYSWAITLLALGFFLPKADKYMRGKYRFEGGKS